MVATQGDQAQDHCAVLSALPLLQADARPTAILLDEDDTGGFECLLEGVECSGIGRDQPCHRFDAFDRFYGDACSRR